MENFRLTESGCLYQWDLNRQIAVNVDCDEVHFAVPNSTEALSVDIHEEDGQRLANVPNILLQEAGTLKVYAYVAGEDESYTLLCRSFKVLSRPKPTGYVYTETEVLTWESLDRRIEALEKGGGEVTDEQIAAAVEAWMEENFEIPESGTPARLVRIDLPASAWEGADSLYSQVVAIEGATPYSKVDLLPSVEQLAIFHNKDVAFVTENEDGVVTVYAIGDKPLLDYQMQAQITEVTV